MPRLEPVGRLVRRHLRHVFRSGVAFHTAGGRWTGRLGSLPFRGGPRFQQFEHYVWAGVGEQSRLLADDHRADEQGDLADELDLLDVYGAGEDYPGHFPMPGPSHLDTCRAVNAAEKREADYFYLRAVRGLPP